MTVFETNPLPEFEGILAEKTHSRSGWKSFGHLQVTLTVVVTMLLIIGGVRWGATNLVTVTSYQTAFGERETVTLSDGTVIELNTRTSLSVHMSTRERRVVLEDGEAYFTVAHEEERPFIVNAKGGHIRDIGTQFSVYTQEDRVLVAVKEGSVHISLDESEHQDSNVTHSRQLTAGVRMAYTHTGRWTEVERIDSHMIAAWREGKIVFEGMALNEAIQEIKRYWPEQIILADTSLADTEVRGVIDIKNLAEFFQALPSMLPVQVTHDPRGRMILSKQ